MSTYLYPPVSVTTIPPMGGATSANQTLQITEETAIHASIGDKTDAAATTDTGTFSIIAFIKRGMQNWAILLSRIPVLVGGKIPVVSTDQVQTGSFDEDLTVSTTPETFIAPAGAFSCFIETKDDNPTNIRVKMGGTASTSSGIQFQAGRSEFYQGGSNISYCTESGSVGQISVQWFIKT